MGTATIVLVIFAVLLALALAYGREQSTESRVFEMFAVDPKEYELIAYDLGHAPKTVFLQADGVVGVCDALFQHKRLRHLIVGEFKSRSYGGKVTDYERCQMTMYQGVVERRYRKPALGLLKYGCGKLVEVEFNPDEYRHLIGLAPKVRALEARWR